MQEKTGINARLSIDPDKINAVEIPLLGRIDLNDYSIPVLTVVLAGMDAFNPCAFFVLLFLLSMMVHAQSRTKMLIIGSTFVFMSGFIYFIFMAAWLNLFMYLGEIQLITFFAGLLAVLIGLINIKDYFYFKKGVSLSIADDSKPKLFDRMRQMLRVDSMFSVVIATMVLAIVANSYELLCTAGFPMIYTRILTLAELPAEKYYLYLLLYNFIYIIPLLIIVLVFTIKLVSKKLTQHEGQVLKLLSGVMMLLLGSTLLLAPDLLNNLVLAVTILLVSVISTWLLQRLFPQNKLSK